MDEKQLLSKLNAIVSELQAISTGLGTTAGVGKGGKGQPTLSRQELAKIKATADETAKVYKKTLGLGYNQKDADATAERFRIKFGLTPFFNSMNKYMKDIRDQLVTLNKSFLKNNATNTLLPALHNIEKSLTGNATNTLLPALHNIEKSLTGMDKLKPKSSDFVKKWYTLSRVLRWDELRNRILDYLGKSDRKNSSINNSLLDLVSASQKAPDKKEKKTSSIGEAFSKIVSIAGLLALGTGLFFIINALIASNKIDTEQIKKVLMVVGGIALLFVGLSFVSGKMKSAAIGFAVLAATMLFLILPLFKKLGEMDYDVILDALLKFGLVAGSCIGLMWLMGKIKKSNVIVSTLGIIALVGIIGLILLPFFEYLSKKPWEPILKGLGMMATCLGVMIGIVALIGKVIEKFGIQAGIGLVVIGATALLMYGLVKVMENFANKPWEEIFKGLGLASLALVSFISLIGIVGALTDAFFAVLLPGAIAIAAAEVLLFGLVGLMDYLGTTLLKYNTINSDQLVSLGKALLVLAAGLTAMVVGTVGGAAAGVVDKLASFFNVDPASRIKEFEKIDAQKILNLGTGLKNMGEGLRMLSSGIDLKNITKDIIYMTKPLKEFSQSVDSFSASYNNLDKIRVQASIDQNYKLNVEKDNGIQLEIKKLHDLEITIQQDQLTELRNINNNLVRALNSGGVSQNSVMPMGSESMQSIRSTSFNTKNSYMNNLKLTSMALEA